MFCIIINKKKMVDIWFPYTKHTFFSLKLTFRFVAFRQESCRHHVDDKIVYYVIRSKNEVLCAERLILWLPNEVLSHECFIRYASESNFELEWKKEPLSSLVWQITIVLTLRKDCFVIFCSFWAPSNRVTFTTT
jgi:hypothetical protein